MCGRGVWTWRMGTVASAFLRGWGRARCGEVHPEQLRLLYPLLHQGELQSRGRAWSDLAAPEGGLGGHWPRVGTQRPGSDAVEGWHLSPTNGSWPLLQAHRAVPVCVSLRSRHKCGSLGVSKLVLAAAHPTGQHWPPEVTAHEVSCPVAGSACVFSWRPWPPAPFHPGHLQSATCPQAPTSCASVSRCPRRSPWGNKSDRVFEQWFCLITYHFKAVPIASCFSLLDVYTL